MSGGCIKDGGKRKKFASGAVREPPKGRGRFDLISPVALELLAKHHEDGAVKYPENNGRNWELGLPLSRFLDAAMSHINKHRLGLTDEPHDVAAFWNLECFVHTRVMIERGLLPPELDDLPSYVKETE
jgi:hypothetical protein